MCSIYSGHTRTIQCKMQRTTVVGGKILWFSKINIQYLDHNMVGQIQHEREFEIKFDTPV